ncbi:MAG: hypothetical protein ACJAVQ_000931 [Nonlabens sp.]|jgi:hypothetical protein
MKKINKFKYLLNLNKKTLTGLFLFLLCFIGNAQISGTAVNELKEPVAFANSTITMHLLFLPSHKLC